MSFFAIVPSEATQHISPNQLIRKIAASETKKKKSDGQKDNAEKCIYMLILLKKYLCVCVCAVCLFVMFIGIWN